MSARESSTTLPSARVQGGSVDGGEGTLPPRDLATEARHIIHASLQSDGFLLERTLSPQEALYARDFNCAHRLTHDLAPLTYDPPSGTR